MKDEIALAADPDETARLINGAKTDSERCITYDPAARPEVSSLLLLAALCQNRTPEQVASDIGSAGAAALKKTVTEAVNEYLARSRSPGRNDALSRPPALPTVPGPCSGARSAS